ncbi:MAG: glycoside-pentoside-hexuronide (GPH):cation symporter [Bacilli bacterium]|nr:glycoside-pentoside-hexuronide (GPH):cation symporter [Bacilli bacterium]
METNTKPASLSWRSKLSYSLGGIGRDMTYTLVATFFITYIQYAGLGLSVAQFSVIGILLIIGRVWDAVNDPIMGAIIENTKTKWGKFKPWILIGAVLTAVVIVIMFNWAPTGNHGWNFVIFFGVIYLLWEIAFTMNDISYWSMLPALSRNPKERDSVATLAVVFAAVGTLAAHAGVSLITVGDAVKGYSLISIVIAFFLVACQCLTVFGVKQDLSLEEQTEENVSIKKMFSVIKGNDQLLWVVLAMLLYNIGSGLLIALGYNFFYLELGYDGWLVTIFVLTFGISNIAVQSFYPVLSRKFGRKQLLKYSIILLGFGYLLLLLLGFIPILPINIYTICIFGALVFAGQSIFYMVLTINITNTVEYNEYKTTERNESVIFSLRPFMAKMASALQQGLVTAVLVISGIYTLSQNVSSLEKLKFYFDQEEITEKTECEPKIRELLADEEFSDLTEQEYLNDVIAQIEYEIIKKDGKEVYRLVINKAANKAFKEQASGNFKMRFILRMAITAVPILLVYLSYLVLNKKYIIDETMYQNILNAIEERKKIKKTA